VGDYSFLRPVPPGNRPPPIEQLPRGPNGEYLYRFPASEYYPEIVFRVHPSAVGSFVAATHSGGSLWHLYDGDSSFRLELWKQARLGNSYYIDYDLRPGVQEFSDPRFPGAAPNRIGMRQGAYFMIDVSRGFDFLGEIAASTSLDDVLANPTRYLRRGAPVQRAGVDHWIIITPSEADWDAFAFNLGHEISRHSGGAQHLWEVPGWRWEITPDVVRRDPGFKADVIRALALGITLDFTVNGVRRLVYPGEGRIVTYEGSGPPTVTSFDPNSPEGFRTFAELWASDRAETLERSRLANLGEVPRGDRFVMSGGVAPEMSAKELAAYLARKARAGGVEVGADRKSGSIADGRFSLAQVGVLFGSALGRQLAGDDLILGVATGSVLGVIGLNVGQMIEFTPGQSTSSGSGGQAVAKEALI